MRTGQQRIASCSPSLPCIRRLIMKFEEFPDGRHFGPFIHNDYDCIHGIIFHLYGILRERSPFIFSTNAF